MDGRMLLRWVIVALVGIWAMAEAPGVRAEGEWQPVDDQIREGGLEAPVPILEVHFAYDADAEQALRLAGMELKRGYAPLHDQAEVGYMLSLLSARGDVLATVPFQIPNRVFNPPPEGGGEADGEPVILRSVEFALTVGMPEAATELQVADPEGLVILKASLNQLRMQYEDPEFESLKPEARSSGSSSGVFVRAWRAVDAWLTPWAEAEVNSTSALDIAVVGDNYTAADAALFDSDVNRVIAHMLTYEPYKSRASQLLFHRVMNSSVDLGCVHSASTARLITCNGTAVTNTVNNAGAPYDKIIVLVKDSSYGGSGGTISVSYNGSEAPMVVVHEFGHSLAGLLDEYNLYSGSGSVTNTTFANCYAGTPPNTLWNVLTGVVYTKGCKYPNWYRSSSCSIMQSLSCKYFNEVSKKEISKKLDFYAGAAAPVAPVPVLTLAAAPALVSSSGSTSLSWSATDATNCTASGAWSGTKPASGSAAVTPVTTKTYSLACTGSGGSASKSVTVTVDAQLPIVALTSPLDGTTVQGAVSMAVQASDNQGIQRVDFYVDGGLSASDNTAPYAMSWSADQAAAGTHALTAKAVDAVGNTGDSAPVTVIVDAAVVADVSAAAAPPMQDLMAPVLRIPVRLYGAIFTGKYSLTAFSTDNVGVKGMELYLDGVKRASSTTGKIAYTWDPKPASVAIGAHALTAKAFDAAGNVSTETITIYKQAK